MKKQLPEAKTASRKFAEYLTPEYVITCQDAIIAKDNTVSFIRVIDQLIAFILPFQLMRFVVATQLSRNTSISLKEFRNAKLAFKVDLLTPSGLTIPIAEGPVEIDEVNPWLCTRSITDLSGRVVLPELGEYRIRLLGKTEDTEFEELLVKRFPLESSRGVAGIYTAEFSVGASSGSGIIMLLPDGTAQGEDHSYTYHGRFDEDKDKLRATLVVTQKSPNSPSVFGDSSGFTLELEGSIFDGVGHITGTRPDKPNEKIVISLSRQLTLPNSPSK